jgi:subtilisin family serine protease
MGCALIWPSVAYADQQCFQFGDKRLCGTIDESLVVIPLVQESVGTTHDLSGVVTTALQSAAVGTTADEQAVLNGLRTHFEATDSEAVVDRPKRGSKHWTLEHQHRVAVVPRSRFPQISLSLPAFRTAFSPGNRAGIGKVFQPDTQPNEPDRDPIIITDLLVLKFSSTFRGSVRNFLRHWNVGYVDELYPNAKIYSIRNTPRTGKSTIEMAGILDALDNVEHCYPDLKQIGHFLADEPNDSPLPWHLENTDHETADINVKPAWAVTTGSEDVVIAILDGGFNPNHPDLENRLLINESENSGEADIDDDDNGFVDDILGWSFFDSSGDVSIGQDNLHGQAVAGLAVAERNDEDVVGVCPGCKLIPISAKFDSSLATALMYARARGADIISMSWYVGEADPSFVSALTEIGQAIPTFAAAGNHGPARVQFPARHPDVIAVGGSDCDDLMFTNQHHGDNELTVVAPTRQEGASKCGLATLSWDGSRFDFGGTSGATPQVAGVAGLLLSHNPELTRDEIIALLTESAAKLVGEGITYDSGYSQELGFGRIDAGDAMDRLLEMEVTPTP